MAAAGDLESVSYGQLSQPQLISPPHSLTTLTMLSATNLAALLLAAALALVMSAPAPEAAPGGLLDGLFKQAPLLGPLGGFGAGAGLAGLLGYKTKE